MVKTKIIAPGGGRYLGLAEQRLGALKGQGLSGQLQQHFRVGDAEIVVSTGPGGDKIIITVDGHDVFFGLIRKSEVPNTIIHEDECLTLKATHPRPKKNGVPEEGYAHINTSWPLPMGRHVIVAQEELASTAQPAIETVQMEGPLLPLWYGVYPVVYDPARDITGVRADGGQYAGVNLVADVAWVMAPLGVDDSGDTRYACLSSFGVVDATWRTAATIIDGTIEDTTTRAQWPRAGHTTGNVTGLATISRGKIAFFFHKTNYPGTPSPNSVETIDVFLVIGDVFANSWSITNIQAIPALASAEFYDQDVLISPEDGVVIAFIAPKVASPRLCRSTDGGSSWADITGSVPGGFGSYQGGYASIYGVPHAASYKPGHALIYPQVNNAAETQVRFIETFDSGVTWREVTEVSVFPDAASPVPFTSLYATTSLGDVGDPEENKQRMFFELHDNHYCGGEPIIKVEVGLGDRTGSDGSKQLQKLPRAVFFGELVPLMPGHPGRLEQPPT